MLRIWAEATKTKWDKRTKRVRRKITCWLVPTLLTQGAGRERDHRFYRFTSIDIQISIQKVSLFTWYSFWLQKLYHSTLEIFKGNKLSGNEQAAGMNIIYIMLFWYCAFWIRPRCERTLSFRGNTTDFIKSGVHILTGCRICDSTNCINFARLQIFHTVFKAFRLVRKFW